MKRGNNSLILSTTLSVSYWLQLHNRHRRCLASLAPLLWTTLNNVFCFPIHEKAGNLYQAVFHQWQLIRTM